MQFLRVQKTLFLTDCKCSFLEITLCQSKSLVTYLQAVQTVLDSRSHDLLDLRSCHATRRNGMPIYSQRASLDCDCNCQVRTDPG